MNRLLYSMPNAEMTRTGLQGVLHDQNVVFRGSYTGRLISISAVGIDVAIQLALPSYQGLPLSWDDVAGAPANNCAHGGGAKIGAWLQGSTSVWGN